MIRSLLRVLVALVPAAAIAAAAAGARADGLTVIDGSGVTQTTCAIDVLGTLYPCHIDYGSDGTNYHPLLTDSAGRLVIEVDGSDSSLPLPANAAQESGGHLASIDTSASSTASSASTTAANTGAAATEIGATTSPAAGSVNGQLATLGAAVATAANQTNVQASAGSSSSKAVGVQGVAGGVAVTVAPVGAASNNGSTTITTGGSFQTLLAANSNRRGCFVLNPNTATEPLYVSVGVATASATTSKSIPLAPGDDFRCASGQTVETSNIAVEAATTGHVFVELDQ